MRFYKCAMLLFALSCVHICCAQTCVATLTGKATDRQGQPITGAVITLLHTRQGTVTDSLGNFAITGVCAGAWQVMCQALGYAPVTLNIAVAASKHISIVLTPATGVLTEVTVNAARLHDLQTATTTTLSGLALLQTRGLSLGEALKDLPGLNTIQTGPSLAKPVIHGLYGNRVLIVNNGVRQEGQQWGAEHAPEIDPFAASKITVIKGAASVRYGADAIGGVVLVTPPDMPVQPGIAGDVYAIGATNGQMGALSATLQGAMDNGLKGLSWRVQGTLKDAGNFHTPHYYLTNSGLKEGDYSATVGYKWKQLDVNVYYSRYYTEVGIFYGAESGNLAELQSKFALSSPGLPSYFSYAIDRPYQTVMHQLLKAVAAYDLKSAGKLELTFGRQNDIRQEYDELTTTNPAAANSPQLRFQLITHTVDLVYTQHASHGFSGSLGVSGATSGNTFEGIRSLIPNYRDYNSGAFAIERYATGKLTFEAGARLDYRWLRVYERDPATLGLYNETYQYNNATATIGSIYRYNDHLTASLNVGSGWRPPSINEMYIDGEHFSDASFEVGDSTLKSERSVNTSVSLNYTGNRLRIVADIYYNSISNYIYDKPALKYRQLPSGIFPEFDYTQANVHIKGLDATVQYDFLPRFTFQSKTTIVRGYNQTIQNWLVGMPADRFVNGLEYQLPKLGPLRQPYVSFENAAVLKQVRVPPNSDYVPPPSSYSIYNANLGFSLPMHKQVLNINFTVNNLTNVAYRDYLNHFRYYADELGVNYTLRIKYSF